jgi:O-antigen/teichoic acid export membrane protein
MRSVSNDRTPARAGFWWLLDRGFLIGSAALVQIILARQLGPASLGELSAVLAVVSIGLPLARAGLSGLLVRDLLASPERENELLATALAWRLMGAVACAAIGVALLPIGTVGILALSLFGTALQLTDYSAQARSAPRDVVPARIAITALAALIKIVLSHETNDPSAVAWVFAAEYAVHGLWQWQSYEQIRGARLSPRLHGNWSQHFAGRAPWLLFASLAEVIYLRIDIVMLESIRGASEAGTYAVAARLSEIWYAIPQIAMMALFPWLWRLKSDSAVAWRAGLQASLDGLFWMALMVAVITQFAAPPLVSLLFGEAYAASATILSLHIWAGLFVFTRALISRYILTEDLIQLSVWSQVAGAATNVALNWWLIPRHGAMGAAVATLVSYGVAGWLVFFCHPKTRWLGRAVIKAAMLPFRWSDLREYRRRGWWAVLGSNQ